MKVKIWIHYFKQSAVAELCEFDWNARASEWKKAIENVSTALLNIKSFCFVGVEFINLFSSYRILLHKGKQFFL